MMPADAPLLVWDTPLDNEKAAEKFLVDDVFFSVKTPSVRKLSESQSRLPV